MNITFTKRITGIRFLFFSRLFQAQVLFRTSPRPWSRARIVRLNALLNKLCQFLLGQTPLCVTHQPGTPLTYANNRQLQSTRLNSTRSLSVFCFYCSITASISCRSHFFIVTWRLYAQLQNFLYTLVTRQS